MDFDDHAGRRIPQILDYVAFPAPKIVLGNYHGLSDVIGATAVLRDDRRGHDSRPVLRAKRGFRDFRFDIASSTTDHANAVFGLSDSGGFWVTEE